MGVDRLTASGVNGLADGRSRVVPPGGAIALSGGLGEKDGGTGGAVDLTVMAIFRNEAPYLAEWLAFHLVQGVQRFVLYNNRSTDGWREVIAKFADVVTVVDWDRPAPCQMAAYAHYFSAVQAGRLPGSRWTAVLDCDEFLFPAPEETRSLLETIDDIAAGENGTVAPGVGVNWMVYNGYERDRPPADHLTIEAYISRCVVDHPVNAHIKTIADPMRVATIRDPHCFGFTSGEAVTEERRPIGGPWCGPSHQRLRINHYLIRSRPEWEEKIARGRADTGTKRDADEWKHYAAPVVDTSAAMHAAAVLEELARRGALPRKDVTA
jgi:hypothetical protein